MLKYDIQMFNDGDEDKVNTPTVFKAFETEEEFNKYAQSVSSKAKGEILSELGIKSVSEAKERFSKLSDIDNLSTTLKEKETAYAELETKFNTVLEENAKTKESLILTKFSVPEEFQKEFMILAKAGVGEDKTLEQSAEDVVKKLNFTNSKNQIIIGGQRSKITEDEAKEMEKLRRI